jgi:glycosyltransferase involved in cell wall biosynthesis
LEITILNNNYIDSTKAVRTKQPTFAIVAAVNDDDCLANNLAASPMIAETGVPLIIRRGYQSAALGYNNGLDYADTDIVIFAHQDVYFPRGWEKKMLTAIQLLELQGKNWGALGIIGTDKAGNLVGGAWSNGLQRKIESSFTSPAPVRSFDEIVLVLRKNGGLSFDGNLPSFHLYGTDIALSAIKANLGAYVFDAPVVHNSLWCKKLDSSYYTAYRYMRRKWRDELPIYTQILPITRFGWPVLRNWCIEKEKWIVRQFKPMPPRIRYPDPQQKAQEFGYEYCE